MLCYKAQDLLRATSVQGNNQFAVSAVLAFGLAETTPVRVGGSSMKLQQQTIIDSETGSVR